MENIKKIIMGSVEENLAKVFGCRDRIVLFFSMDAVMDIGQMEQSVFLC